MRVYEKKTINDKSIFENDIIHFKTDGDIKYKLGKVVFEGVWKIVHIGENKAIKMDVAYRYYNLKVYKY